MALSDTPAPSGSARRRRDPSARRRARPWAARPPVACGGRHWRRPRPARSRCRTRGRQRARAHRGWPGSWPGLPWSRGRAVGRAARRCGAPDVFGRRDHCGRMPTSSRPSPCERAPRRGGVPPARGARSAGPSATVRRSSRQRCRIDAAEPGGATSPLLRSRSPSVAVTWLLSAATGRRAKALRERRQPPRRPGAPTRSSASCPGRSAAGSG